MITKIKVHDVASYRSPVEINPRDLNFIYGGNGSGKSTLAAILADELSNPNCSVEWQNGTTMKVLVYDRAFVKNTFGQDTSIPGVFTLGKEGVDDQAYLKEKRELSEQHRTRILGYQNSIKSLEEKIRQSVSDINETCWALQQKYGSEFAQALTGFRNSKNSFREKCMLEFKQFSEDEIPNIEEIRQLYKTAYGKNVQAYSTYETKDTSQIAQQENHKLLKTPIVGSLDSPVGEFIKLLGHSDWVRQGMIYQRQSQGKCPYCQQPVPSSLKQDLMDFFDETYELGCKALQEFQEQYFAFTEELINELVAVLDNPIPYLDYGSFKSAIETLKATAKMNIQTINLKLDSPSKEVTISSLVSNIEHINGILEGYNALIQSNNEVVQDQRKAKQHCEQLLWRYFVNELKVPLGQFERQQAGYEKGIASLRTQLEEHSEALSEVEKEIAKKEASLTSVIPTVNAINDILTAFGFDGFYLSENPEAKGTYKIVRPSGENACSTLSEGEYNFITFLYFFHLAYGSHDLTGILSDRVIVIDDPVSSLDSSVLFIVTTLMRQMLTDCLERNNGIRQVFVLTHNIYFFREVTFRGSRTEYPPTRTSYWILRKINNETQITEYANNPIQTTYELLWSEIREAQRGEPLSPTIFNTMRRILEYYFNVIGGLDYEKCIAQMTGTDKIVCGSLISWANDGSHFIMDDHAVCLDAGLDNYLRVFRLIFDKMGQGNHYDMMMQTQTVVDEAAAGTEGSTVGS